MGHDGIGGSEVTEGHWGNTVREGGQGEIAGHTC